MQRLKLLTVIVLVSIVLTGCGETPISQANLVMERTDMRLQHVSVFVGSTYTTTDYSGRFWYKGDKASGQFNPLYGGNTTAAITPGSVIEVAEPADWGQQYIDDLIGFTFVYVDAEKNLQEIPYLAMRWVMPTLKVRLDMPLKHREWYEREVIGYWQGLMNDVLQITITNESDEDVLVQHVDKPTARWYGVWAPEVLNGTFKHGVIEINVAKIEADHLAINRHEFGHALGLMHSRHEGSLMHPLLAKQHTDALSSDELHALRILYSIRSGETNPKVSAQRIQRLDRIED